jgi:hypothetical protein
VKARRAILFAADLLMKVGCWLVVKADNWRRRRQPVREYMAWMAVEDVPPVPTKPRADCRVFWVNGKSVAVTAPEGTTWGPGGSA